MVIVGRWMGQPERLAAHVDRLYRAAWALCGSQHDAEDLVQETYARVLARPRVLRRRDELPYMLKALRNTYLTGLRTASRRPRTAEMAEEDSMALASRAVTPDMAAQHHELLATIRALPTDLRDALIAVDIVGLTYREAARALSTRETTVTMRIFHARRRVAQALA